MIVWIPLALIGLFILRGLGDFTEIVEASAEVAKSRV